MRARARGRRDGRRAADRRATPRSPASTRCRASRPCARSSADPARSEALVARVLGFSERRPARLGGTRRDPRRAHRLRADRRAGAARVAAPSTTSRGRVTRADQEAWRRARPARRRPRRHPVIDRFYFESVYFREPSGILYELATSRRRRLRRRRARRAPRRAAVAAAQLRAACARRSSRRSRRCPTCASGVPRRSGSRAEALARLGRGAVAAHSATAARGAKRPNTSARVASSSGSSESKNRSWTPAKCVAWASRTSARPSSVRCALTARESSGAAPPLGEPAPLQRVHDARDAAEAQPRLGGERREAQLAPLVGRRGGPAARARSARARALASSSASSARVSRLCVSRKPDPRVGVGVRPAREPVVTDDEGAGLSGVLGSHGHDRCLARIPRPVRRGATFGCRARAASLRAPRRAISSAGRAPPRQGGGHWFEPSIAHQKVRICGPFVFVVRDQFLLPPIGGSRLVRPPWLAWQARESTRDRRRLALQILGRSLTAGLHGCATGRQREVSPRRRLERLVARHAPSASGA